MSGFRAGDAVTVPGKYRGLIVRSTWQRRTGETYVLASFVSGHGYYEGPAAEFSHDLPECSICRGNHGPEIQHACE